MKRFAAVAAVAVGVVLGLWALLGRGGDGPLRRPLRSGGSPSYAQLVAANYKVLSAKQSSRLLRFADAYFACMRKKGVALGRPQPHATKIVMTLPSGLRPTAIVPKSVACAEPLGGPPKDASLVQRKGGHSIELYLPKRCLLDRKTISG